MTKDEHVFDWVMPIFEAALWLCVAQGLTKINIIQSPIIKMHV